MQCSRNVALLLPATAFIPLRIGAPERVSCQKPSPRNSLSLARNDCPLSRIPVMRVIIIVERNECSSTKGQSGSGTRRNRGDSRRARGLGWRIHPASPRDYVLGRLSITRPSHSSSLPSITVLPTLPSAREKANLIQSDGGSGGIPSFGNGLRH